MDASTLPRDEEVHRLPRLAGPGFGLIYSLAYGLTAWGIDTWLLARSHAELAGARLAMGLPLLLLIGPAAGAVAGRNERAGAWVGMWMVGGALIAAVAGLMPHVGLNLVTWIVEPRLWGKTIYPVGHAGLARMAFAVALTACTGAVTGLVGHVAAEKALRIASSDGQTRGRRLAWLALGLPVAILPALIGDEIVNRPLRAGQQAVHTALSVSPFAETGQSDVAPRGSSGLGYTLHRVAHDPQALGRQTIDAAFEDGVVVRCQVSNEALAGCRPISSEFEAWMDALIQDGLQGGSGTAMASYAGHVSVGEDTESWLASQRGAMGERYEISRDTQRGGWVVMSARFDTGLVLSCYFRGASPVVVDHCSAG